jgi:hypothetical protein
VLDARNICIFANKVSVSLFKMYKALRLCVVARSLESLNKLRTICQKPARFIINIFIVTELLQHCKKIIVNIDPPVACLNLRTKPFLAFIDI